MQAQATPEHLNNRNRENELWRPFRFLSAVVVADMIDVAEAAEAGCYD